MSDTIECFRSLPAEGNNHATINRELGQPDDMPTKFVFEFLLGLCEKPLRDDQQSILRLAVEAETRPQPPDRFR